MGFFLNLTNSLFVSEQYSKALQVRFKIQCNNQSFGVQNKLKKSTLLKNICNITNTFLRMEFSVNEL